MGLFEIQDYKEKLLNSTQADPMGKNRLLIERKMYVVFSRSQRYHRIRQKCYKKLSEG